MGRAYPEWWGATGNGSTNDRTAIQNTIDYMVATYTGGEVFFHCGKSYSIGSGITIKNAILLNGGCRYSTAISASGDFTAVTADATCEYCGATNIFISGYQNAAAANPAVSVTYPAKTYFANCFIWGGSNALQTAGFDGRMYNCDIQAANPSGAGVLSSGANFYTDVKFDNTAGFAGFFQTTCAASLCENNIQGADFTATYTHSLYISDATGTTAVTKIFGGVFSSPVDIVGARYTTFVGAEFGSSITSGFPISITGSYGFSATAVAGAGTRSCAGNINITC
jgi:hypothetical protein